MAGGREATLAGGVEGVGGYRVRLAVTRDCDSLPGYPPQGCEMANSGASEQGRVAIRGWGLVLGAPSPQPLLIQWPCGYS